MNNRLRSILMMLFLAFIVLPQAVFARSINIVECESKLLHHKVGHDADGTCLLKACPDRTVEYEVELPENMQQFHGGEGYCDIGETVMPKSGKCKLGFKIVNPVKGTSSFAVKAQKKRIVGSSVKFKFDLQADDSNPEIGSVSLDYGATGGSTAVTINGNYFSTAPTVKFGDVVATNIQVLNPNTISCNTPPHGPGTVKISVTNSDGQESQENVEFTYQPPPVVTGISSAVGIAGKETEVTINGSDFSSKGGNLVVKFGGTQAAIKNSSNTQITCIAPALAAGAVAVVVVKGDGQVSGEKIFTYKAAPVVNSASPIVGAVAGNTAVTISGDNFSTLGGNPTVKFGGKDAFDIAVISPQTISCKTPVQAAGAVDVEIKNADGQSGVGVGIYTYQAAPTITNITPAMSSEAGGIEVTIFGNNFSTIGGVPTVTFGGKEATNVKVFEDAQHVTCTTPSHDAGLVDVVITNQDVQGASKEKGFTYQAAPIVTSINPSVGSMRGGAEVTIKGNNFSNLGGAPEVKFDGVTATNVAIADAQTLICITPAHAAGSVNVEVKNFDEQLGTGVNVYTYQKGPSISEVVPAAGTTKGGSDVAINGANFFYDSGKPIIVKFGDEAAQEVSFVNSHTIICKTPNHVKGVVNVKIVDSDEQEDVLANGFTYQEAPIIDSILPVVGSIAGGNKVTIGGYNFSVIGGKPTVTFDGVVATEVKVDNANSLTCKAPEHAFGKVNVVVANRDEQQGVGADIYTYQEAPVISSIEPTVGFVGAEVKIGGANFSEFGGNLIVKFDSAEATVKHFSAAQIVCAAPEHAIGGATIAVINGDKQEVTAADKFIYQAAPTVSSISPAKGSTEGGNKVTIVGDNFSSLGGNPIVKFDDKDAKGVEFVDARHIVCVTPAHSVGKADVVITNADNQTSVGQEIYTYQVTPNVNQIEPSEGPASGNTTVKITGSNFSAVGGELIVKFGNKKAIVSNFSETEITCTTPASAIVGLVSVTVEDGDGESVIKEDGFEYKAPPIVNAVSSVAGTVKGGTPVTITGEHFSSNPKVEFGGTPATGINFLSGREISCITPQHVSGKVDIVVTNSDDQFGTGKELYTYLNAPSIDSFSPIAGAVSGDTFVTIEGSDFSNVGGDLTIKFGGELSTVTETSDTKITCKTPGHNAGEVAVVVTNGDGQEAIAEDKFTYQKAPAIRSIFPKVGSINGGQVSIGGEGFSELGGKVTVMFGSEEAKDVSVSRGSIMCAFPAHDVGMVDVVVTNGDGQIATKKDGFEYRMPLSVSSVSPIAGSVLGGTTVTIVGEHLLSGNKEAPTVTFDDESANIVSASDTEIVCKTPIHSAGNVKLVIKNDVGEEEKGFLYQEAPVMKKVTPKSSPLVGGVEVIIEGSNFSEIGGEVNVAFGVKKADIISIDGEKIICIAPAHAVGSVDILATNGDGQTAILEDVFEYKEAPVITEIDPEIGAVTGGTEVYIEGKNFSVDGGLKVLFDDMPAQEIKVFHGEHITCKAPPHSAAAVDVKVINSDGQEAIEDDGFTYKVAPDIKKINPSVGSVVGGIDVTITGDGFSEEGGDLTVEFDGRKAEVVTVKSKSIKCKIPSHAVGVVDVVVTNGDGLKIIEKSGFTYQQFTVTSVSPKVGSVSGGADVTIEGANFFEVGGALAVKFGTKAASNVRFSNGDIVCKTPEHNVGTVDVVVTNGDGQEVTKKNGYTYQASPIVSSVAPSSGVVEGNEYVIIKGENFSNKGVGLIVKFGDKDAKEISVVNAGEIKCKTPKQDSDGAVSVSVINGDGQVGSRNNAYEYIDKTKPAFTSIKPSNGVRGQMVSGVRISGEFFSTDARVKLQKAGQNDIDATSIVTSEDGKRIVCEINLAADAAVGDWDVVITNPDNKSVIAEEKFQIKGHAPWFQKIEPNVATRGPSASIGVELFGGFFDVGATVKLQKSDQQDISATDVVVEDGKKITCKLPLAATTALGAWDVVVINPDEQFAIRVGAFNVEKEIVFEPFTFSQNPPVYDVYVDDVNVYAATGKNLYIYSKSDSKWTKHVDENNCTSVCASVTSSDAITEAVVDVLTYAGIYISKYDVSSNEWLENILHKSNEGEGVDKSISMYGSSKSYCSKNKAYITGLFGTFGGKQVLSVFDSTASDFVYKTYNDLKLPETSNTYGAYATSDGSKIIVATDSGVSISIDGGKKWDNFTVESNPGLLSDKVYAVSGNVDGTVFYVGTDKGLSKVEIGSVQIDKGTVGNSEQKEKNGDKTVEWKFSLLANESSKKLKSELVYDLYVSLDGTQIYAGTAAGLSVSKDSGETWTTHRISEDDVSNIIFKLHVRDDEAYVATAAGLFVSKDSCASWQNKTPPATAYNSISSASVNKDGKLAIAATGEGLTVVNADDGGSQSFKISSHHLPSDSINKTYVSAGGDVFVIANNEKASLLGRFYDSQWKFFSNKKKDQTVKNSFEYMFKNMEIVDVAQTQDGVIYLVVRHKNDNYYDVAVSTDYGITWQGKGKGKFDRFDNIRSLYTADDGSKVFVATNKGIYDVNRDLVLNEGLKFVGVCSVANDKFYAVTTVGEVYVGNGVDGWEKVTTISSEATIDIVNDFVVEKKGERTYLFVATNDGLYVGKLLAGDKWVWNKNNTIGNEVVTSITSYADTGESGNTYVYTTLDNGKLYRADF